MDAANYFEEIEKYLNSLKLQIEDEKKEIVECQKKCSNLAISISQKAPSNSVINSLFKDEEPEGFVFSKYEEKRKQLAEQRRAEYNAYLEKKEAEFMSRQRKDDKNNISPKSILDSVDYERVLAKRKEEEAKFRNMNIGDNLHHSQPVLNEGAKTLLEDKESLEALEKESVQLLEQRIVKQLAEQKRQMLLEFENELRKSDIIKEEIQNSKPSNSVKSSPERIITRSEEFPKLGRTGGGGDPVRDSYGNLLTTRGQRKDSLNYGNVLSFPSMQQQSIKDRMRIYREELQRQIEEKKCLEAIEKAKAQEQEEKIAQRIEEQRLKMLEEYENDQKKTNKIKQEFQRQQERIRKLEEFQKKDAAARQKKVPEVKAVSPMPEKPIIQERSNSPPIPAVRTKVLFEKAVEAAPKVKPENVFSSLAEIRRKIMEEQQKPKNNHKKSYEIMNRRTVQEVSDDEDDDIFKSSANSYQYSA